MGERKFLKVSEFSRLIGVSKDWVYAEIQAGRLPLATYCGKVIKPFAIDVEKAQALFSSTCENVIPISQARSLTTEKLNESVNHKPVTREDLWKD